MRVINFTNKIKVNGSQKKTAIENVTVQQHAGRMVQHFEPSLGKG